VVSNDCAPCKRPALRSARHSAETIEGLQQIRDAIQNHQDDRGMQSFLATLKDKAIDVVYEVVKAAVLWRPNLK
jgi:hypothetical protein